MTISEVIKELSKLDFRTSILFSNSSFIWYDDLLYISVGKGKVKSYTILRLQGTSWADGFEEYHLTDEYGHRCTVGRERIYVYKGQNLKIQRVYDIITKTISILLIAALLVIADHFPEVWDYLTG